MSHDPPAAPDQILREAEEWLEQYEYLGVRYPLAPEAQQIISRLVALLKAPPSSGPPAETLELKLRREWWLNHGFECRPYGDDGEMQCCCRDFKREPLPDLEQFVNNARTARTVLAMQGGNRNDYFALLGKLRGVPNG